jgi:hypothetical protein
MQKERKPRLLLLLVLACTMLVRILVFALTTKAAFSATGCGEGIGGVGEDVGAVSRWGGGARGVDIYEKGMLSLHETYPYYSFSTEKYRVVFSAYLDSDIKMKLAQQKNISVLLR